MWMDAVIALPLIALGIHGIVARRGGRLLYAMALGYALFSNYYTGFMLCLFAVLWFVYLYLDALLRGQRPQLVRTAGTFAASSLLAGGLAAVMLIPAFLSLRKGYQLFSLEEPLTGRLFPLIELMTKLFTGAASFELAPLRPALHLYRPTHAGPLWQLRAQPGVLRPQAGTGCGTGGGISHQLPDERALSAVAWD